MPDAPRFVSRLTAIVLALCICTTSRAEELRIGTITVVTNDVYRDEEALKGRPYELANALHIKTRESVVRKFLLFSEGDDYIPARLEESERNIRALSFIQSASVTSGAPHDGVVDVTVVTQDAWSTEPGASIGSKGGTTVYGFDLAETNFLGLGKQVMFLYDKGIDRTSQGFRYADPSMFGRYWRGDALYLDNSDGQQTRFEVSRPFFSFATPHSFQFLVDDQKLEEKIYRDAEVASKYSKKHETVVFGYGIALAPNDDHANRLTFGVDLRRDTFEPLLTGETTLLPADREYRYLFAEYELARNRFVKVNFVERDLRYEDYRLGARLTLRAGISPAALGVDETTGLVAAAASRGFTLGSNSLLLANVAWQTRIGAERDNEILAGDIRFIHRQEREHPRALVGRIAVKYGNDLDTDVQFFADGLTGLRGYKLHAFEGDSTLIMNLEQRYFLGREILQLVSPGFAVFVDAGNAGYARDAFKPGNLHVDAGAGLRFGLARTPKNIFRVDCAYAFDADPSGHKGWLISFSGQQAF